MHVRKALHKLHKLADDPPNIATLAKASTLLDGLERANREQNDGQPNGIIDSKLRALRSRFENLCGFGEDEFDPSKENALRSQLRSDVATFWREEVQEDGVYFKLHR